MAPGIGWNEDTKVLKLTGEQHSRRAVAPEDYLTCCDFSENKTRL